MADVIRRVVTQMGLDASAYTRAADSVAQSNEKMTSTGQKVVDTTSRVEQKQVTSSRAVDRVAASVDRAERAQRAYQRQLDVVNRAYQDGSITAERHAQVTRKIEENYAKAERATQKMTSATDLLKRAFIALGGAMLVREVIRISDAWSDMSSRVNIAVGSQQRGAEVMDRIAVIARRTYSSLDQTTESFVLNSVALRDLGYNTRQQLDYTEALNNAFVVSGAKGDRAAAVQNALSKAMADGRLRGENLNTVIQMGGRVAQALADSLGVTTVELRRLGTEGKITSDVMFNALISQASKLRAEADSMPATFSDGLLRIRNELELTIGKMMQTSGASGEMGETLEEVRKIIASDGFAGGVRTLAAAFGMLAEKIALSVKMLGDLAEKFQEKGVLGVLKDLDKYFTVGLAEIIGGRGAEVAKWYAQAEGPKKPVYASNAGGPYTGSFQDFSESIFPGTPRKIPASPSSTEEAFQKKLTELKAEAAAQESLVAAYEKGPAAVLAQEEATALLAKTQALNSKFTAAERKELEDYLKRITEAQKKIKELQAIKAAESRAWEAGEKARIAAIMDPDVRRAAEDQLERQKQINDLVEKYGTVAEGTGKKLLEMWDKARMSDAQARYWDDVRQKAEDVSNDISQFLVDGFVNAQEGGRSMFRNLWDGALQGAKRLVANIAAEFLKARIIMPVVTTIVGANAGMFGIAQAAGVGGGAGGMMSLGGVGNSLLGLLDGGLFSQSLYGAGSWFGTSAVGQALGLSTLTGGVRGAASMPTLTGLGTSFSNALGNLGYGAIGGLAANLFGLGNSNPWVNMGASTIGSIGGSMLGGSLSILGSLGGPLGAIAGGFLGSALGGLFGNSKPSDMFAQTGIDLKTGTLGNTITGRPDETSQQNMDASKALAEQFLALQQQIMALTGGTGPEAAYAKVGSRDGIVVGVGSAGISVNNRQGSNSATFANSEEGAQKALDFMVQALAKQISGVSNPDIQTVLNRGGSAQEMLDNLTMVKSILDATAEAADPLTTALKAVNDNFDDLDKKARDLGLSTDLLTKLEAVRQKQLDEITAGASLGTYQNVQGALSQLTDWMTQQQLSDVSSLNPLGRQSLAQSTFDDLLKAVNDNGDLTKVGALTSSASNLLSIARQNYGSTAGFTSVESQVQQALSNLGLSISSQESIGDQVSRAIALSTQTNTEKLDELKAEIVKMRLAFSLMSQKLAA